MDAFSLGQRVRTTVNSPAMWPGGLAAPSGSLGTIVNLPADCSSDYGVALDTDPAMPANYGPDEIAPA